MAVKKIISNEIKRQNRQLIYQYIRRNKSVSKQDIVVDLQLSLPTVTQNLQYLERRNLVDTSNQIKHTGGRHATAYGYIQDAKVAIGVYVTAHHMNIVAVDLLGDVLYKEREHIEFNLTDDEYLRKMAANIALVKEKACIMDEQILGVGVAVPGLVTEDNKRVSYGISLGFTGVTSEQIGIHIPYPVKLHHDSYVAGYAEVWKKTNVENAFYLLLNNSVGGAIIINNEIYAGDNNKSGDICHVTLVSEGGKRCYCGKYGCLDTLCNAGCLDQYTNGNLDEFFSLLKVGDVSAVKMWDEYLDTLALVINNIRMLFDSTIILGGYVGSYMDEYLEELYERVDRRNTFNEPSREYLISCQFKGDATAVGAAIVFIDEFIENI